MVIFIDNGHGKETAGKRSPDGRLLEWAWTREIARRLKEALESKGVGNRSRLGVSGWVRLVAPEDADVDINTRVRRVNDYVRQLTCPRRPGHGGENFTAERAVLVSIHANAAGNGTNWKNARGWMPFVYTNAGDASRLLAQTLYRHAVEAGLAGNRNAPDKGYWQSNIGICRDTLCPAVLTENLFMDNKEDLEFMLSPEGKQTLVDLHVKALEEYAAAFGK